MNRFNEWLARKITNTVATMWCAYAFTLLALVSLPGAIATHNIVVIVGWIAQTFLQLVLLSVIMVGQNLQNQHIKKHTEKLDQIHTHLGIKK